MRLWTILALLLLAPTVKASEGVLGPGPHDVPDVLVVGPDDTLVIAAGASLSGAGRLEVLGRLEVRGTPAEPALVAVPIRLAGPHAHVLAGARLWGAGTTVALQGGSLLVEDSLFEADVVGLDLAGEVRATGRNVTFRGHSDAGLRVGPLAFAHLRNATFEDNGAGARVEKGGRLSLEGLLARRNGVHVRADLALPTDAPFVVLRDVDLGAAGEGALVARGEGTDPLAPALLLSGGRLHDAPVALHSSHARVRIERATLEDNVVGLALVQAAVELRDVGLGNVRDVEGAQTSQVVLDNVTYLRASGAGDVPSAALAPGLAPPGWLPWLVIGCVAVLAGAILYNARPERMRRAPPPAPAPVRPAKPEDPPPDAPPALDEEPGVAPPPTEAPPSPPRGMERRVLADVRDHPETPQAAVAERLGLTRQAVHYHVKKLEARGLLAKTVKGRETQCRVTPAGEAALALPEPADEG